MSNENSRQTTTTIAIVLISVALSVVATMTLIKIVSPIRKIAYVETSRLMIGYSEANALEKELQKADKKCQKQVTTMKDSLEAIVNPLSKEYQQAGTARKKEIETILNASNQQFATFQQEKVTDIQKQRDEKMKIITQKIDQYISEYGKKHRYDIILGTLQGTIVYANKSAVDVTDEIIQGLNERYK